jgi:tetratricopeptide (TPR) repeat protein
MQPTLSSMRPLLVVYALLGGAVCAVAALGPAPLALAEDSPASPGSGWLPERLWFVPDTPQAATLLGQWPADAELGALEKALARAPEASDPAQRLRQAFAREQLALLRAYQPLVARARVGDDPPSALGGETYAESAALLAAVPVGASADVEAIRGVVLASQGRRAEALAALSDAQRLAVKPSADWRVGLALFTARLRARNGGGMTSLEDLAALPLSPHWAALVEAEALAVLSAPSPAGAPKRDDNTLALPRARHALALFERLHSSGAFTEGVPFALLQAHLDTLARASTLLPAGWITLCDGVALLPDAARAPLLRGVIHTQESSAPPLHVAHLRLCAFEAEDKPAADLIQHLEAAAALADTKLTLDEAGPFCELLLPQLRSSRPWWRAWSSMPEHRQRAHGVVQRCLGAQMRAAAASSDPDALFQALDAASADHLDAFLPAQQAAFALALQRRGDLTQAYDLLKGIDADAALPKGVAAEVSEAHLALALRFNGDLQPARLTCASIGPVPASPEQRKLLRLLGAPEPPSLTPASKKKPASSKAPSPPKAGLPADHLSALLILQLNLGLYADALPTLRALLTHPDADPARLPVTFAAATRCLHDAHRWPLAVSLLPILADLPSPLRLSLLAAPSTASTLTSPTVDHLIQDALLHFARALALSDPPQTQPALDALTRAQSLWHHAPLEAELLLILAETQRAASLPADALLTLTSLDALHPHHPLADDALWLAAHILIEQGKLGQAADLLHKILSDHPSGSHLWRANDLLRTLPDPP